jgi:hypothetical protein
MSGVLDPSEPSFDQSSRHRLGIVHPQLEPRTETRFLIVWGVVGELEAEAAAIRETSDEKRLIDAGCSTVATSQPSSSAKWRQSSRRCGRAKRCALLPSADMASATSIS